MSVLRTWQHDTARPARWQETAEAALNGCSSKSDRVLGCHRRDVGGDPVQFREKTVAHLVARGALRVGRQVDGAERLAAAVQNGHRKRAQAELELLVDDRKT